MSLPARVSPALNEREVISLKIPVYWYSVTHDSFNYHTVLNKSLLINSSGTSAHCLFTCFYYNHILSADPVRYFPRRHGGKNEPRSLDCKVDSLNSFTRQKVIVIPFPKVISRKIMLGAPKKKFSAKPVLRVFTSAGGTIFFSSSFGLD